MSSQGKSVRIAGGSAFWGDSSESLRSLVEGQNLDYLMLEYLAEITMALLAGARAKSAEAGYVPDFISAMDVHLDALHRQGIKVVTNAGGNNAAACGHALAALATKKGIALKIAVVEGDDLTDRAEELRGKGIGDWRTSEALPANVLSINAYLGASPIAAALGAGADVVITGRGVDSALALGPLMHEFGWRADDYDLLAAGSVCGHLIECGPQMTGGNFTDWESVPGWDDMGYPIAECYADGTFVVSKPAGTGGLVSPATVGEQLLYEIDDPSAYLLPDVAVDLRQVELEQVGENRVRVTGALGRAPTPTYKATVTFAAGYRCIAVLMIGGIDAARKARRTADALLERARRMFRGRNLGDFDEVDVEVLGSEATYGPMARAGATREVMLKIGVKHQDRAALQMFAKEVAPSSISMAPGITGFYAGRPTVTPVLRTISALVPKADAPVTVTIDERRIALEQPDPAPAASAAIEVPRFASPQMQGEVVRVPLVALAYARSGDKGDDALIAVLARKPEYLPYISHTLTDAFVADHFAHLVKGKVSRYEVPGVNALIFQLRNSLGGGGITSIRIDPQGKALGQMMLAATIEVPLSFAREHRLPSNEDAKEALL